MAIIPKKNLGNVETCILCLLSQNMIPVDPRSSLRETIKNGVITFIDHLQFLQKEVYCSVNQILMVLFHSVGYHRGSSLRLPGSIVLGIKLLWQIQDQMKLSDKTSFVWSRFV